MTELRGNLEKRWFNHLAFVHISANPTDRYPAGYGYGSKVALAATVQY
jgi:hypothetical protein